MGQIGPSRGTKAERLVQALLGPMGAMPNYRIYLSKPAPGCKRSYVEADAAVPELRLAVFVDGRFWHDPEFARARQKPSHKVDWEAKARRNAKRDRAQTEALESEGWLVVRVWDDQLQGVARTDSTLSDIAVAADAARIFC